MQLILSTESVRNTIFSNETGQVLYKTTHPSMRVGGMTTIHKVVPNDDPMDMRDQFEVMGLIEWHVIGSSTFHFRGEEMQSKDFLRRHGTMGRKRTFTGPDDRPYRWDMLLGSGVVLSRDSDDSKTEVARYHRGSSGIVGPKKSPQLDVDPEVMHMLDLIIFTFVHVETLCMYKEKARRGYRPGFFLFV